jgi:hypothetical protein
MMMMMMMMMMMTMIIIIIIITIQFFINVLTQQPKANYRNTTRTDRKYMKELTTNLTHEKQRNTKKRTVQTNKFLVPIIRIITLTNH